MSKFISITMVLVAVFFVVLGCTNIIPQYESNYVDGKRQGHGYAVNELPMYGKREKTAEQKHADKIYIETMTKDGISRADAANTAAKVAWNTFYAGDKSTAIKRFNQAWLLDSNNQLALWGFAAISFERNQVDEALKYFQMAIDSGPENADLQRDYERVLKMIEQ